LDAPRDFITGGALLQNVPLDLLATRVGMGQNRQTFPSRSFSRVIVRSQWSLTVENRLARPEHHLWQASVMNQATTSYDPYAMPNDAIREPPKSLWQALCKIGPGIILAGSIVGSGELIQTTTLGAKHGFIFLWLILFSCVIKVFVQIELGRYAISSGKPTLGALHELPGPRLGTNWLVWWWLGMVMCTVFQLGGMVGGVGQALNLAFPDVSPMLADMAASSWPELSERLYQRPEDPWAAVTSLAAIGLLLSGGYKRIELFTTLLVVSVTLVTVVCVVALPATGFPLRTEDLREGFSFILPAAGIAAAFSTFGITGVGASELYSYPYWCLEKGYARFAGRRDTSDDWARRARGWIRVMHLDAWASMIIFTMATVAFYVMGATVLYRQDLHPDGSDLIATLSQMYVPAFGAWTTMAFLIGAWAVLFKTLYVASAGHSRLLADFFSLSGILHFETPDDRARWIRRLCVFFPLLALALHLGFGNPRTMVQIGGFAQAATLPIISCATLFLRFRRTDPRLAPSRLSDACLCLAAASISIVAMYALGDQLLMYLGWSG
jgi:Mn2+/Fe2+ NRAMP family transporter